MTALPLTLRGVALRSVRAHPVRTAVLLFTVAVQAACALIGLALVEGVGDELSLAEQRLGADIAVYPTGCLSKVDKARLLMLGTPVDCNRKRSSLGRLAYNDDFWAASHQLYFADTLPSGEPLWIVGFEPETDFVLSPWLEGGPGWALARGEAAVGSSVAASSEVALFQRDHPVAARLMETGSALDNAVFVTMETLGDVIRDSVAAGVGAYASVDPGADYSAALVRLGDRDRRQAVTDWINLYVRKTTAVKSEASLAGAASGIRGQLMATAAAAVGVWLLVVAALAVVQAVLMNERRGELGVWRVVGASPARVARLMAREALLVHAAGACAGTAVWAALLLLGALPGPGGAVGPARALANAAVVAAASLIAGAVGTRAALRRAQRAADGRMLLSV